MQILWQKLSSPTATYILSALMLLAAAALWGANKINYYHITDSYVTEMANAPGRGPQPEAAADKTFLITLPYMHVSTFPFQRMPPDKIPSYLFTIHVNAHWYQTGRWHFIPDDCVSGIRINDVEVPFYLSREERCDVHNGFSYDLKPYMHNGDNTVVITVSDDQGGDYGLSMAPIKWSRNPLYGTVIAFLIVAAAWLLVLRNYFDVPVTAMALVSLWCGMRIFTHTTYMIYNPDYWGHVDYIDYIRENFAIPLPHTGWSFFNPPLYYAVAALADVYGRLFTSSHYFGPRCLSILLLLAFEFYGLLTIRALVTTRRYQLLCCAMFLFWPLFPALIGRVNNESMLYTFWAAAMYYLLQWDRHHRSNDMAVALTLCGLMFLVKTSALVPFGVVGAVILYHVFYLKSISLRRLLDEKVLASSSFTLLCIGFNFGRTLYDKMYYEPRLGVIIGNVYTDRFIGAIRTTNTFEKFFTFNWSSLFAEPYWFYTDAPSGANFFWLSYFKTMVFGDFSWPPHDIAISLNVTFLLIICFAIAAAATTRLRGMAFVSLGILMTLVAQIVDRLIIRTTITNEARFTFPVMILLISLLGMLLERLSQSRKWQSLGAVGEALVGGFTVFSFYFISIFI